MASINQGAKVTAILLSGMMALIAAFLVGLERIETDHKTAKIIGNSAVAAIALIFLTIKMRHFRKKETTRAQIRELEEQHSLKQESLTQLPTMNTVEYLNYAGPGTGAGSRGSEPGIPPIPSPDDTL